MSTEDAKAYLSTREVPRLFECLMTGLMFHRPNDHIQYLIDSLEKVKLKGQAEITWNMFVEVHSAKTPLPPILPENGKRPASRGQHTEDVKHVTPISTPLPPIGSGSLTNVPVILIMGGPCSGKSAYATRLAAKYPGWVNVHLGELLRTEIHKKVAHDKWKTVQELVINGDLAPEDVTFNLLHNYLKNNTQASGFIIHGFPRNMAQAQLLEKTINHVDAVLLIDCEEENLMKNSILRVQKRKRLDETPSAFAKRMQVFKEQTLPVLKYYDDGGKLYIIDGDQNEDSIYDKLATMFQTLLQSMVDGRIPTPPPESRPSTGRWSRKSTTPTAPPVSPPPSPVDSILTLPTITFVPPPEIKVKDEGRRNELPTAPIIFLAGGPGSGKGTQCAKITARYPDICHLSMGDILRKEISEKGTVDDKWLMITKLLKQGDMAPVDVTEELLIQSMNDNPDAQAYLVEGYPRDALQYEEFNRNIGGHAFTILLDCDSQYMHDRLVLRGGSGNDRIDDNIPAIEKKLAFFARNTLPLLKAIEDENKLIVINGDRDEEEIFYDIVKCLDFSLYGTKLQEGKSSKGVAAETDEEDGYEDQMIVEKEYVAVNSTTTGEGGINPEFTSYLDGLDDLIVMTGVAAETDEEDGYEDQMIVEKEYVAVNSTTTGEGGINPEFTSYLDGLDDLIVMTELEAEEFEAEVEQEGETVQESEDGTTDNAKHVEEVVEEMEHTDLLTGRDEEGTEEDNLQQEDNQTNVEEEEQEVSQVINDAEKSETNLADENDDIDVKNSDENGNEDVKNDDKNGNEDAENTVEDNQQEQDKETFEKLADVDMERDADTTVEDGDEKETEE